jgi:hypothetical protein
MPNIDTWDVAIMSLGVMMFLLAVASLFEFIVVQYNRMRSDHHDGYTVAGGPHPHAG